MPKPGGASITGRIVRAWRTHDGVLFALAKTAHGWPQSAPIQTDAASPDELEGRNVTYLNGSWFLTSEGVAT